MIDMSRMPTSDMLSVRGIGVADSVSTSTLRRICLMRSLCATPKRCSSSTTSRPRSRKITSFDSRRCVPTMMSRLPATSASSATFCSALLRKRDTMSMRTGNWAMRSRSVSRCWKARIVVGARIATCLPSITALNAARMRHLGLAVADVAAQQAVHGRRALHVALDVGDRGDLVDGQVVGEGALELLLPMGVGGEGVARHRLARGVELQQLLRHVAHRLLDLGLGALPAGAAEAIERRPGAARVLLDQVEPLDRDEQLVLAVIAQLEELGGVADAAAADLLEPDELADAVVDVDDEIADLQVAEVGEEGRRHRALAPGRRAAAPLRTRRARRTP